MRLFTLVLVLVVAAVSLAAQQGWRLETASAPWSAREYHASVEFDSKLWILGGAHPTGGAGDSWATNDGVNWSYQGSTGGVPVSNNIMSEFNGELWTFGGLGYSSGVWRSPDGITWTQEPDAPWPGRNYAASVVFDGKLWVLGGVTRQAPSIFGLNDVWSTPDGVNWTQEVAAANWSGRAMHTATVFNNRIWIIGGGDGQARNDVWSSADGVNWVQESASAPWGARGLHATVAYRDQLWVIGGSYSDGSGAHYYGDVWSSVDGANWVQETAAAAWGGRTAHSAAVYDNRIWFMGGHNSEDIYNDVWSYGLHVSTDALADGIVDRPYFGRLEAREGDEFFTWTLSGGSLPPGLTLDTQSTTAFVTITGTPETAGEFTFTVEVEDGDGHTAEQEITLTVNPPPPIGDDGNGSSSGTGCTAGPGGLPWLILYGALTLTAAAILRRRAYPE